jgi:cobalt-zinc-cadmium efflux system outer membrane protein
MGLLAGAVTGVIVLVTPPHTAARALTWADARAQAQRNAPELAVGAGRSQVARAELDLAGALANPTFTVTTARETARLATGVSVPLPLFGQRGTAVGAARADADAVEQEREVVRNDVRWSASLAWVDAWEATQRARLLAGASADAQRLATIATERFEAGAAPRLDVVRAGADRVRAQADATSAQTLVDAAGARLAVWVGGDPRAAPTIDGGPGVPARLPTLAALLTAVQAHPSLARDRAQGVAAERHVDLERRLRFPIVNAEVTVLQGDPTLTDASGRQRTDVVAGAAFELPVLNARGGAIARAQAQGTLAAAGASLDTAHLRADVVDAFLRTRAAAERARALAGQALPALDEARALTEESYRAGRADLVRVLESQRALVDARLAEVDTVATWARAFADLERAAGRGLDDTVGAADAQ